MAAGLRLPGVLALLWTLGAAAYFLPVFCVRPPLGCLGEGPCVEGSPPACYPNEAMRPAIRVSLASAAFASLLMLALPRWRAGTWALAFAAVALAYAGFHWEDCTGGRIGICSDVQWMIPFVVASFAVSIAAVHARRRREASR